MSITDGYKSSGGGGVGVELFILLFAAGTARTFNCF